MAKIMLVRGKDALIKNAEYVDGSIYLSKDKYKLYADYDDYRNELNNGIVFMGIGFEFPEGQTICKVTLPIPEDIELQKDNMIIQVQGTTPDYIAQRAYCAEASGKTLTLSRSNPSTPYQDFINVFIYDAASGGHRITNSSQNS